MKQLIDYVNHDGITYFDWNVYGGDGVSADIIVNNVTASVGDFENSMILFHDAADKEETVKALPRIIEYIQSMPDTEIVPVSETTVPVQHISNK
jgi:peptidoglycan/xylan/chitin deacetylase (PgdA/CDA1 family)